MSNVSILALFGFLAACTVAASAGALFRPGDWYDGLKKPAFQPPKWLFAPVWTLLYIMIAVSGWLVWTRAGFNGATLPLGMWLAGLILNALWSPLFFGRHRIALAFLDIVLLWLSIAITIWLFLPVERNAALLLVPYFAWVSFAALLSLSIWRLNPRATR